LTTETVKDRVLILIKLLADDTKSRFAKMLELYPSNIDAWVNQNNIPGGEHLLKFHDKLNINLNWLLIGEGEMFCKKEQPSFAVHEPLAEYGYNKEEREYIDKLIKILRTKQDKTTVAIKQNIDAFLDNPDKVKEPVKKTKAG